MIELDTAAEKEIDDLLSEFKIDNRRFEFKLKDLIEFLLDELNEMAIVNGEWDGICACGKAEQDSQRCKFGATHQPLKHAFPWAVEAKETEVMPWMKENATSS